MKLDYLSRIVRDKRAFKVLNAFILLLIAVAAIFLTRNIVSTALLPATKTSKVEKKPHPVITHNFLDYATILKKNPFGFQAGELTNLLSVSAKSAPSISPTDVVVIGTIAGRKDLSYAIIADKTGDQEVYRIGDSVLGFGKLLDIGKDKVVIDSNGKHVDILMVDIGVTEEPKHEAAGQTGGFGKKTGESSYVIDRAKVQAALDKPEKLMTDARFLPSMAGNGRQQGFILKEVKPGGIYDSLGLVSGDVLMKINDFTINNPEAALQAFSALRGIDKVQMDVIRNGTQMTLTYQIK